jgi:uncharacterized membrane protein
MKYTINGYMYGNMQPEFTGNTIKTGERVRWYILSFSNNMVNATSTQQNSIVWTGNNVQDVYGDYTDMVILTSPTYTSVDMVASNKGEWMLYSGISQYTVYGMSAMYGVIENDINNNNDDTEQSLGHGTLFIIFLIIIIISVVVVFVFMGNTVQSIKSRNDHDHTPICIDDSSRSISLSTNGYETSNYDSERGYSDFANKIFQERNVELTSSNFKSNNSRETITSVLAFKTTTAINAIVSSTSTNDQDSDDINSSERNMKKLVPRSVEI